MKKNILVLDDSPFILKVVSDLLESLNYGVTTVKNGKDACEKLNLTRYDMIITDMNMPDMDGFEFTRRARACPGYRFLPIVMLSSEKNEEKISKAKKMGVSTFLSKPLKEAQLRAMLQINLNKRMTPRLAARLKVFYKENKTFSEYNVSYTFNVSLGGVFIESDNPLPPGETLDLKISVSENDHPIVCQGRVVRVKSPLSPGHDGHPPGMGLEFLNIEDEHLLQKFLKSGSWKC